MNYPVIASHNTCPPPAWALMERRLIDAMNEAAPVFQERYTRAGSFQRSIDGLLIDQGGNPVQGEGGDIQLGTGDVVISSDGTVTVGGQVVNKLKVFEVRTGYAPVAVDAPQIQQGTLEMSNVNAIKEMLGLVETQRAYDLFQKMMRTVNDAYGQSIRNVGTVS